MEPTSSDSPDSTSDAVFTDDSEHASIVARQAILDEHRVIVGYELFNRSPQARQHNLYSDANLLFSVLSLADAQTVGNEKTLFINCTHDSLVGRHLDLIHPARVVLELPPVEGHQATEIESRAQVMGDLHRRGFRFAFDHTVLSRNYATWRPFVSYVKLDLELVAPELVEPLVRYAGQNTTAQLIATKVETHEQFQTMSGHGIKLFQGYWFAKPVLLKSQAVRPAQAVIIHLIERVRADAEVG